MPRSRVLSILSCLFLLLLAASAAGAAETGWTLWKGDAIAGVVGVRIHQFQTAAPAIGPLAPATAVGVVQLVSDVVIGIAQGDGFTTAGQIAAPGSQRGGGRMQQDAVRGRRIPR